MSPDPLLARQFATQVVAKLRDAGFEALWAGGCVRDQLMGKLPKDYDVATSAVPDQIRDLFGRRRTLAIGAAFGVITVLGPDGAGQIEVATFRRDVGYSDGRRPDMVAFTSAEEDARRRDFTINGIFLDPLTNQVIDYVGGQEDLRQRVLRAIGNPHERFAEDKLRMLRAVRFAATLDFAIDRATLDAVRMHAAELSVVSIERIAAELRRILLHDNRALGVYLLREAGLLEFILPEGVRHFAGEVDPLTPSRESPLGRTLGILRELHEPTFSMALAALLRETWYEEGTEIVQETLARWKLANDESEGALRLLRDEPIIRRAWQVAWPVLQRVLIAPRCRELIDFSEAVAKVLDGNLSGIAFCQEKLALPPEAINPPPLITGDDLQRLEIPSGPIYRHILETVRDEQLEGRLTSREEAEAYARKLTEDSPR